MQSFLLVVHILLAICLIGIILLQHGKGADAGAAFGSGASATVFGARGSASFLTRATAVLAILFFSNSFFLDYLSAKTVERKSLMEPVQTGSKERAGDATGNEVDVVDTTIEPIAQPQEAAKEPDPGPAKSDVPQVPGAPKAQAEAERPQLVSPSAHTPSAPVSPAGADTAGGANTKDATTTPEKVGQPQATPGEIKEATKPTKARTARAQKLDRDKERKAQQRKARERKAADSAG